ncbi:MAG: MBL fold metallo-hydrolase [Steroidobacteraceae bacterium]|jgi:glyoxylase-like metal-dependent hydrolase (beta-lactamase superfamily II)
MSHTGERVAEGVIAIDTEFMRPRMDASHLIVDDGHAAFVDTGTFFSVPNLLAALAAQNLDVDAVDYVLLTHVHLDHAGGVGRLAAALPRARVLVHPRGLPHIIDPSILAAATQAVYGEEAFAHEYGEVSGVPAERVDAAEDGRRIRLGRRTLELFHTPGHALHHLCIVDRDTAEVFTGDAFGVSYRELDTAAGEFIFPTTSPSQFDPQQLHASIDRILEFKPTSVYLTHYSRVGHVEALAQDLHSDIDAFVRIASSVADAQDVALCMAPLLFDHLSARLAAHGFEGGAARQHAVLDDDIALNAAGLAIWLGRRGA